MKKIVLTLCIIGLASGLSAQSTSPTVIATSGGFASGPDGSVSYTIGEMSMIKTFTAANNILTQGFQQPNEIISGLLNTQDGDFGSFAVYPNPAVNSGWVGFQLNGPGKVAILLYNDLGQQLASVYDANYSSGKIIQPVNYSPLSSGTYFLTMTYTSDKDSKEHTLSKQIEILK